MWSFLTDLLRHPGITHTVVILDTEEVGRTRRHQLTPKHILFTWGISLLLVGGITASLMAFTPLRTFIPGYGTKQLEQEARLNAIRVAALQDSVAVQRHYIRRLQQLMTGRVDSVARTSGQQAPASQSVEQQEPSNRLPAPSGRDDSDRAQEQPAIGAASLPATPEARKEAKSRAYALPSLSLPVKSPVKTGFPTREFNASDAHFGVDIAVSEGTVVRAVGEGYVVLADWAQSGGYTIAVQHADGYLSVYKHNKKLLKQTGEHVRGREALAVSGNTGEMTTGPHLHFELWQNGLAQDPRPYVTGW
jgi:murein DD-endopeptidase MepM/ murein hydrolase activator NlpD